MENLFVEKRIAEAPIAGGAYFKDKIVFIGPTYDLLHDKLTTPFGEMPGVVWHAQVAADLLNGAPLHYIGRNASLVCFGICIALTALCVILLRNAIGQSASLFGAGVSYDINKNVVADVSWMRIQAVGNTALNSTDTAMLGLSYHF